MGCSSSAEVKVLSNAPTPLPVEPPPTKPKGHSTFLTDEEVEILKASWNDLNDDSDLSSIGKRVFLQAFEMRPEMKKIFPFDNCWGDKLLQHPKFQAHAQSFMVIIENSVEQVDNESSDFSDSLTLLGQSHSDRIGFTRENVQVFLKAILAVWHDLLKSSDDRTEKIWSKFLAHVVQIMRNGYEDAIDETTSKIPD
ncbi:hypothetical protein CAPTEDRAFT_200756 [Capitella teleta]|uniref:Globin domain-containing protein n=1 Tax=Capitella teleta TaxID=283909 RepID=R7TS60_CAPTE|nr:hypothetical protein CAPTEDRAFT_200756 [Capitella teleta]|eukprot:ELT93850.1 hypothetical protein CAPTEDRAFT_200756 [Capitella teleta]